MTLQNMKYIIEITQHRSFSEAAKCLYVSQAALSLAVKETETELGITLFKRTNRGVILTPEGEDFLKHAREIVEQADFLKQRYQNRDLLSLRFSVSAQRLPFAAAAFHRLFHALAPERCHFALREVPTQSVIQDLAADRSDLGIVCLHDSHMPVIQKALDDNDLDFCEIGSLPLRILIRSGHPLARKPALTIAELEPYPFVIYDQEGASSHFTEEILLHELSEKTISVSDRATKLSFLRNSDCFSIGPVLPEELPASGEVVAVPFRAPVEPVHVGYLISRKHKHTDMMKKYLKYLEEELKRHDGFRCSGDSGDFPG
ncbi:MAG: LysR family transcriptional regulator [Eubacteriales bacterium]|nr:LysR family transcriptional regulator [Eubacteriales bacterium]